MKISNNQYGNNSIKPKRQTRDEYLRSLYPNDYRIKEQIDIKEEQSTFGKLMMKLESKGQLRFS